MKASAIFTALVVAAHGGQAIPAARRPDREVADRSPRKSEQMMARDDDSDLMPFIDPDEELSYGTYGHYADYGSYQNPTSWPDTTSTVTPKSPLTVVPVPTISTIAATVTASSLDPKLPRISTITTIVATVTAGSVEPTLPPIIPSILEPAPTDSTILITLPTEGLSLLSLSGGPRKTGRKMDF